MAMNEEELAKFHDEHKGDLSIWADKPAPAEVKKGSVVFSLRFSRKELEAVRALAEEEGVAVGDFIRRAALREASQPTTFRVLPGQQIEIFGRTTSVQTRSERLDLYEPAHHGAAAQTLQFA